MITIRDDSDCWKATSEWLRVGSEGAVELRSECGVELINWMEGESSSYISSLSLSSKPF